MSSDVVASTATIENVKDAVVDLLAGPTSETGEEQGVFSKIKQTFSDISDAMKNKDIAFDVFEKNLLFLKGFFLFVFIILALVNYFSYKNVGLISKRPGLFAVESMVFGLSGVIPFVILCYLRNQIFSTRQIVILSIVLFVAFFILNYLLELGGVYAATFEEADEKEIEAANTVNSLNKDLPYSNKLSSSVSKTSNIVMAGIIIGSLCALLFSAFCVKDFSPVYTHFANLGPYAVFFVEMLLFGVISAVPIFFMASNRKVLSKSTTKEFFLIVAKFAALHCVLQVSGLYRHMFTKKP